ncbi:hypothetical protein [Caldisalinibacter kiritimatiensis]|uniref:Uncharacterized protein n=1 Tax=Caldisalinibacter kiritimatiensis TaxID=1304284 RepID=R1CDJ3_9FIRM|nr:hypothetical protein [Caldisalinibacter kiritimatiensis]EOD00360.1 hypothetical protein L21TH_1598 [Caldisalinibacter kiritimatiensis]
MKKRDVLLVILIVLFTTLLIDYFNFRLMKIDNKYYDEFKDRLYKVTQEKTSFNMKDVTPFQWDKMYIISPYTSKSEIQEIVGIKWTTSNTYLGYLLYQKTILGKYPLDDDIFHKLVFIKGEEVLLDITLNRMEIDFTKVKDVVFYNKAEFVIKKEGDRCIILKNR